MSRPMYQTERLARTIYNQHKDKIGKEALIIALEGPLGVGKTTFAKALAKAMDITDTLLSPSFTLHGEYPGLDHIDLWRIEDPAELTALGLERMIKAKRTIVIEWAEKARAQILKYKSSGKAGSRSAGQVTIVWIKFEYGTKENERRITWKTL